MRVCSGLWSFARVIVLSVELSGVRVAEVILSCVCVLPFINLFALLN